MLTFARGNAKLGKETYTFSLPAGWSCPFAVDCLSKADREDGAITYGKRTEFRCFAASAEAIYPNVRRSRWNNFEQLRWLSKSAMVRLIESSLPVDAGKVRIHVSGDFFNQTYFDAWCQVAKNRPDTIFYAYTKAVVYWVKRLEVVPSNFVLTASRGGSHDLLIDLHGLRSATVVFSVAEAEQLGLEIDHDDSHAISQGDDFAILLHGVQPAGTRAAEALRELKKQGIHGYSRKKGGRIQLQTV